MQDCNSPSVDAHLSPCLISRTDIERRTCPSVMCSDFCFDGAGRRAGEEAAAVDMLLFLFVR